MITFKLAWVWAQRCLQSPTLHSLTLIAVTLVGIAIGEDLSDMDKTLKAQTTVVEQLKTDFQIFKTSTSAVTDRLAGRVELIEQRVQDMDTRLRRREEEFEHNLARQRRAMEAWENDREDKLRREGRRSR